MYTTHTKTFMVNVVAFVTLGLSLAAGAAPGSRSTSAAVAGALAATRQHVEQNVNYNMGNQQGVYEDYTPGAVAPSIDPTAPCYVPASLSGAVPGISLSGGTAYEDKDCTLRELVRLGLQSGQPTAEAKAATLLNGMLDKALAEASRKVAPTANSGISGYSDLTGF